jgi:hypothetical protein
MAECHYCKNSISKSGKMYQLKPEILQAFMDLDGEVHAEGALAHSCIPLKCLNKNKNYFQITDTEHYKCPVKALF